MEVARTKFAVHYVYTDLSMLEQVWTDETNLMTDDEYKIDMYHYLKFVEKYQLSLALIDTQKFQYLIPIRIQTWVDKKIAARANKIVKHIAFIVPKDIFAQVSVQQTMEESEGICYQNIRYFENKEEAKKWLLSFNY